MRRRVLAAAAGTALLAALTGCRGSSSPDATAPAASGPAAIGSPTTVPAPTSPGGTLAADAPDASHATVTEAEVAQIEQQLDEIDQLLNDLDAELAAD